MWRQQFSYIKFEVQEMAAGLVLSGFVPHMSIVPTSREDEDESLPRNTRVAVAT